MKLFSLVLVLVLVCLVKQNESASVKGLDFNGIINQVANVVNQNQQPMNGLDSLISQAQDAFNMAQEWVNQLIQNPQIILQYGDLFNCLINQAQNLNFVDPCIFKYPELFQLLKAQDLKNLAQLIVNINTMIQNLNIGVDFSDQMLSLSEMLNKIASYLESSSSGVPRPTTTLKIQQTSNKVATTKSSTKKGTTTTTKPTTKPTTKKSVVTSTKKRL